VSRCADVCGLRQPSVTSSSASASASALALEASATDGSSAEAGATAPASPPPKWQFVVFDEIHRLKNPKAKGTVACRNLAVGLRYGLTGTLIQVCTLAVAYLVRLCVIAA
jgi:hypothetical protein